MLISGLVEPKAVVDHVGSVRGKRAQSIGWIEILLTYIANVKSHKVRRRKMLSMKINDLVAGIFVIFFGAILFADAIQTTWKPANELLSTNDVKGITGFILIVIAIFYFIKAKEKT